MLRRNARKSNSLYTGYSTREQKRAILFRYQTNLDQFSSRLVKRCQRQHRGSPKNTEPNPTQNSGCDSLHKDLRIETAKKVIGKLATPYEKRHHRHLNILAIRLIQAPRVSRLKRKTPADITVSQPSLYQYCIIIAQERLRTTQHVFAPGQLLPE